MTNQFKIEKRKEMRIVHVVRLKAIYSLLSNNIISDGYLYHYSYMTTT
jgi:hypothetical protein